jgi:acyl-CoA thioesterase-1
MHKIASILFSLCCLLVLPALSHADEAKTHVACVGDSITAGVGTKDTKTDSYPAQLGKLLGEKYEIGNFGVSGATLLNHGDRPYQKQGRFKNALEFKPDIVVIMLGTNDTKPQNWKLKDEFVADYKNLIDQFKELPTHPRIFVCLPPPVPGKGNYGINQAGIDEEIPMIKQIAQDEHAQVIDVYDALKDKPELLPDRVHPNTEGAGVLAATVNDALTAKSDASR